MVLNMKYHLLAFLFIISSFCSNVYGQTLPNYKIYNKSGKEVNYGKMVKSLGKAELIFIGEQHNNPLAHWLEMKVIRSLDDTGDIIIGMEMFETDTQKGLDLYLAGSSTAEVFAESTRHWSNYNTDYAPIIEYAKSKNIKVIASNCPTQYARMIYKDGFEIVESLVDEEQKWMAPLPIPYDATLPGYKGMLDMMPGHGGDNLPKAQAIKDATMANSIVMNWPASGKFIHVNGAYHSNNFEGILWYMNEYRPGTKMMTISTVVQSSIDQLEADNVGVADFIIVIDKDVTTSY